MADQRARGQNESTATGVAGRVVSSAINPLLLGVLGVLTVAVLYPLIAERAQQPLTLFVIPILITAALGSWTQTAAVGALAVAVSLVEGLLDDQLEAAALAARMLIVGVTVGVAMLVAFERQRRQQVLDESQARGLLLDTLQDSLVPVPIPPPGITVRVRYIPGDDRLLLGGDFFDAIALPNGALGYIIGDVCGQGARAAAFGAALRSGWKTLATMSPDDPVEWVLGLDQAFFRLGRHADTYATLNTGLVECDGRRWRFVSAGHPWPIVQDGDTTSMVRPSVGPPLGLGVRSGWEESGRTLGDDSVLLLYTDGLIENPSPDDFLHRDGEQRLLRTLQHRASFDIDSILRELGPGGFQDDVAVMAVAVSASGR
jgi:serine phosphatase RsbU (regulator of sigma subunit)